MIKIYSLFLVTFLTIGLLNAQTVEELTAKKEAKAAELAKLEGDLKALQGKVNGLKSEVADLTEKTTPYPRWETGSFGTVGFNFTRFNDWFQKDDSNTSAATIGFTLNGFANLQQKKYFWRNAGNLNLSWLKFDNKEIDTDEEDFQVAADAFNLTSLFGYKLTEKFAISTLAEYRTAILDGKLNNPGYLDIGAGATWTPINDLVIVFHPGNYNFVFSDDDNFDFQSSVGMKIVADYARKLSKGLAWKTNFSTFISYEGSEMSNWTWINGFSTAVKGIGVGIDIGLRQNKQEAEANEARLNPTDPAPAGNPLQMYYVLGLSYNF
jgi:hypothetical protein